MMSISLTHSTLFVAPLALPRLSLRSLLVDRVDGEPDNVQDVHATHRTAAREEVLLGDGDGVAIDA